MHEILWDFDIQMDLLISNWWANLEILNKKEKQ